jgi:hypothetical protein
VAWEPASSPSSGCVCLQRVGAGVVVAWGGGACTALFRKVYPMPKRIDHVAIIVRNIEQALVFYCDTLGIAPSEIKEIPTEQVRIAFLPMGGPGGIFAWKWTISTRLLPGCRKKERQCWISSLELPLRDGLFSSIQRRRMECYWN